MSYGLMMRIENGDLDNPKILSQISRGRDTSNPAEWLGRKILSIKPEGFDTIRVWAFLIPDDWTQAVDRKTLKAVRSQVHASAQRALLKVEEFPASDGETVAYGESLPLAGFFLWTEAEWNADVL